MTKLIELTKDFKVSRPVLRLELVDNDYINANIYEPIYKYEPTPIAEDILSQLVCENYRESFDVKQGRFTVDPLAIANKSMEDIRKSIIAFIEKNSGMKNPRQSKLYRWTYRSMPNSVEMNDVLVMVYKYLRSFSAKNMKAYDQNHIKNGIAILEAIMEKYE